MPFSGVVDAARMVGEDEEETSHLHETLNDAREFLESQCWCSRILHEYFGTGVGGVFGLFLFHLEPTGSEDTWLWVVAGDLPSAYFVVDDSGNPKEAMQTYDELIRDWISAVRNGSSLEEVFPFEVSPTLEHAEMLETRLDFLKERITPHM
ncbi:MAG: hypothetical protein AAFV32_07160 [Myxococcota bacterium]